MINVVDDYVGELRQKLTEQEIADNTLIIYSSHNVFFSRQEAAYEATNEPFMFSFVTLAGQTPKRKLTKWY